jgi:hypothetical protein
MNNFEYQASRMDQTIPPDIYERRNEAERRQTPAQGFTYINTVGWICRREQFRRKDDPNPFSNYGS